MTLPMDIRLAAESARFGFVFTRRGIVPEAASSWFLPRVVGISRAAEWCYTGRVFGAEEALAGGLVRSVHPDGELLDAAYELAGEIAANTSQVSVALARQMLWRMLGEDHPMAAHRVDSALMDAMGAGPTPTRACARSSRSGRPSSRCGCPRTCPPPPRGGSSPSSDRPLTPPAPPPQPPGTAAFRSRGWRGNDVRLATPEAMTCGPRTSLPPSRGPAVIASRDQARSLLPETGHSAPSGLTERAACRHTIV